MTTITLIEEPPPDAIELLRNHGIDYVVLVEAEVKTTTEMLIEVAELLDPEVYNPESEKLSDPRSYGMSLQRGKSRFS